MPEKETFDQTGKETPIERESSSVRRLARKEFLTWGVGAGAGLALAGCGLGGSSGGRKAGGSALKLSLAETVPTTDPYVIAEQEFAKKIRERTGGRIEVTVYPGGQLGGDLSIVESVKLGIVDMAVSGTTTSPVTDAFYLPYLFADADHQRRVMNSEVGGQIARRFADDTGLAMVGWAYFALRHLTTKDTEVRAPEDMNGVVMRVPQIPPLLDTWKAIGAGPVPIDFTELFGALQTGVVNAQENPYNLILISGFYEVQNYLIQTQHGLPMRFFYMNGDVWNEQLGEEDRQLFQETWREVAVSIERTYIERDQEDLNSLKEEGMQVVSVDTGPFREATDGIWRAYAPEAWGEGVYERMQEMR